MLAGLPAPQHTLFTIRLPLGLTPRTVTAGYDAPEDGPARSFLLTLDLAWEADAPRIQTAWLEAVGVRPVPVPPRNVRLAVGPGLADYDLVEEDGHSFLCYVQVQPLEAA